MLGAALVRVARWRGAPRRLHRSYGRGAPKLAEAIREDTGLRARARAASPRTRRARPRSAEAPQDRRADAPPRHRIIDYSS